MIVIVIVAGALKYGGHSPQLASQAYQASAFGKGFLEGYNTLDALASVAFSVVAVVTLNQLGFKSKRVYFNDLGCWFHSNASLWCFVSGTSLLGNHFPSSSRTTKRCQYWC
ncbi:MAG: branched-chain amino acid transport system II carrier protein [Streptococcus sp.]